MSLIGKPEDVRVDWFTKAYSGMVITGKGLPVPA